MAAGLVVRDAGASELTAEVAAMKNVSNTVAGLSSADPAAIAAAAADRGGLRASRDAARVDTLLSVATATADEANDAATLAERRIAKERAAALARKKAKAAAARKAAAEAQRKRIAMAHRWVSPFHGYTLTSGFGWRWGRMHPAQDLAAPTGTPVYALSSGTVIFSGWSNEGYGYFVKIRYWDGTVSWYAHNSQLLVSVGEEVSPGEKVAYSGSTGNSTGPHLHLEIHTAAGAVAPRTWLSNKGIHL